MNEEFYINKPRMLGVRGWSLLIPASLAAIGFCAFTVLAFSFTELQTLPATFRRSLVIVGAFSLAIGGEIGTLAGVVEVFRKRKHAEVWDWLAIVVSAMSTIAAFVLSFAALLGSMAQWSDVVKVWGPIILGVLAALDSYATFSELGMYLSTYDERMAEWEAASTEFRRALLAAQWEAQHSKQTVQAPEPEPQVPQPETAITDTIAAIRAFYASHPLASQAQAGQATGVSRQRVGQVLADLEQAGAIRRNGNGVEVLG